MLVVVVSCVCGIIVFYTGDTDSDDDDDDDEADVQGFMFSTLK